MTRDQHTELTMLLEEWVASHPAPDCSTLLYLGYDYSPREICEEVLACTMLGESLGNFLFQAAHLYHTSVREVIARWESR